MQESITCQKLKKLQEAIGYKFKNFDLLLEALTHPSMKGDEMMNYQRLEFLGDSFLGFIVADHIYNQFPDEQEGFLAKRKTLYCNGSTQSQIAKELQLLDALKMSDSAKEQGLKDNPKIMEDVLESLIGAIYKDGGYLKAKKVVKKLFFEDDKLIESQKTYHNPKGILQEHYQAMSAPVSIEYIVKKVSGPDHAKKFKIGLLIDGKPMATGEGFSKKRAEESAALEAIEKLSLSS